MFERRLKIFLGLLSVAIALLLLRGATVQLFGREYWKEQAADAMKRTHLVDTSRGRILDRMGRTLAVDIPCIDACVDYRAIESPPNDNWVRDRAVERLHAQLGDPYAHANRHDREQMRASEIQRVQADIKSMWEKLAKVSGRSIDEIEEARDSIARKVQFRRQYIWYHNYLRAVAKKEAGASGTAPGWKKWFFEGGSNSAPDLDKFRVTVAEELESHVILPAIDAETQNELGKDIDRYPGLVLRPGSHREYPYGDVACHLLGQITHVDAKDLQDESKATDRDELRQYLPNDLIGRTGIEALCEPLLRGTRGRYEKVVGDDRVVASTEPLPGKDVKLSIDIELQQEIQTAFSDARLRDVRTGAVIDTTVLHGAAVVLDVKSGEVRAMVSYPTYDNNKLDELYSKLRDDDVNSPLMNRATMAQHEPGSTAKPMVGLSAITEGLLKTDEGIECTGFLVLGGKKYPMGRCWIASQYFKLLDGHVAHHPLPYPHPTGFLTFGDGLERSCNVFFETTADRLGFDRLSTWFGRFGLGRPTGIGIGEAKGRVPSYYSWLPPVRRRPAAWFAGIGQGYVLATPIQMGNVAATIARKGVWMRPTLLSRDTRDALGSATTRPSAADDTPDVVDLHIPPDAIAAAWDGMGRVVNGKAGTGKGLVAGDEMLMGANIAGKTGTAQAAPFRVKMRDANGNVMKDEDGKERTEFLQPSNAASPNLKALWYRGGGDEGKTLDHAWYMGFAPADNPQIAFVAMVEYGGSGGIAAASVAREALGACIAHHYLQIKSQATASGN